MNLGPAKWTAWIVSAVGALLALVGYFLARPQFFRAYWMAWLFWGGLSIGALALISLQALTGGRWTALLRLPAQAAAATLPLTAVLIVPLAFGFREVFPWAAPGFFDGKSLPHHQAYLTVGWFWFRAILYFAILIPLAFFIRAFARARELKPESANRSIHVGLGGIGAVAFIFCTHFMVTDWIMSLEVDWSSTVFATIFMSSQFLSVLALSALVVLYKMPSGVAEKEVLRDIGNLLLAFVIFWAYVSFSQFLIIWAGNLPHEISWYVHRREAGWPFVVLALGLAQFLLPFALLLSRSVKHRPRVLAGIAAWILAANVLHDYWLIAPSWHPHSAAPHWLDLVMFITVGGVWLGIYFRKLEAAYV